MSIYRRFLAALSFLTRIPVPRDMHIDEDALAGSPPMFPVVGAVIGLFVAAVDRLAIALFSPAVAAVLDIATGFVLTAGLHFDGFVDTVDGLSSGKSRERILEIMKDSRVGAMGVFAGALVVALEVTSVAALPQEIRFAALIVAPVIARYLMVVAMTVFPYARPDAGLGRLFAKDRTKKKAAVELAFLGSVVAGLVFALTHTLGVAAFLACCLLVWVAGRAVCKSIGGLTGDVYGALSVMAEACMYLLLGARWRWPINL